MVDAQVTEPEKSSESLRVGCYNIAHGRGAVGTSNFGGGSKNDKRERIIEIAKFLKEQDLDIVVLNEADFDSIWSGHIDQAWLIAKEAGYRYVVEQRNIDVAIPFISLRFGNAILSRFPLSDMKFLDYPHPSRWQELLVGGFKDGVAATVTLPDGQQLQVAAVHLSLEGESYRQASVQIIHQQHIQSKLPMIAMGDFNSTAKGWPGYQAGPNDENAIDWLMNSEDWHTWPEILPVKRVDLTTPIDPMDWLSPVDYTFPSQQPEKVIDWIFVTTPWLFQNKEVIRTELSDHLPVIAKLKKHQ
ncbi:MAG: endonuclease/exonuclease/phosphatase family protein [Planctomycetota bacterium]